MSYSETETVKCEDTHMYADVKVEQDECYSMDDEDLGRIEVYHDRQSFRDAVTDVGFTQEEINALVNGEIVIIDGEIYLGLERYSHSGDVYARCQSGNFPDRRWDVSPIVGWICPDRELDKDAIKPYMEHKEVTYLFNRIDGAIQTYNDVISGNVWGYNVSVYDQEGTLLDEDGCWGFIGDMDYCMTEGKDAAEIMMSSIAKEQEEAKKEKEKTTNKLTVEFAKLRGDISSVFKSPDLEYTAIGLINLLEDITQKEMKK